MAAPDADAGKALLGDGRVDHALVAELLEQALADLVGALVLRHLLAHQEHVLVAAHLLGHGIAQRLAHGLRWWSRCRRAISGSARRGRRRALARRAAPGLRRAAGSAARGPRQSAAAATWRAAPRLAIEHGDRRVDLDALGALGDQQLGHLALVDRLHLHGGLVGLDLGDDVAGLDVLALRHQPFGELALLHGGRQRGHQDLGGHRAGVLLAGRVVASAVGVQVRQLLLDAGLVIVSARGRRYAWSLAGSTRTTQHSSGAAVMGSTPRRHRHGRRPRASVTSARSR